MQWWYQADINLAGTMEMAAAVAEVEEDGVEEQRRGQKGRLPFWGTSR